MSINYGFNNIISSGNIDISGVITAVSGIFSNLYSDGVSVSISGHNHLSSDITDFSSVVSGLLPSGTTDYVARWVDQNTIGIGIIYDNNTDVGISTTTPSGKLDVFGNLTFNTFTERVVNNGNSGTTKTLSIESGTIHKCTLTGNCVFTMPSTVDGKSFTLFLDTGSGNFTASFSSVRWNDSVAPTITSTSNKIDILNFISDGSYWYGSYSQNYG